MMRFRMPSLPRRIERSTLFTLTPTFSALVAADSIATPSALSANSLTATEATAIRITIANKAMHKILRGFFISPAFHTCVTCAEYVLEPISNAEEVFDISFVGTDGRSLIVIKDCLETRKELLGKISTDSSRTREKVVRELVNARIEG